MNKRKTSATFLAWCAVIFLAAGVGVLAWQVQAEKNNVDVEVPEGVSVMEIDLNGVTLEEMKAGDKSVKYAGNSLRVNGEDLGEVEIKGRGNTTWAQEKKPWQIEFETETELLGITKAKKWVLLADYLDETHLRNWSTFALASMLEEEFVYEGKFVELSFDGEYEGLYYLVPKIEIGKGVVDLRNKYGVLVELDNYWADESVYTSFFGENFYLKGAVASKDEEAQQEAMQGFLTDFNRLEKAVRESDYVEVAEIVDVESWAKYFLVNEFVKNPDVYMTSTFMYKDGNGDKIHIGPIWDFDLALGNANWIGDPKETREWKKKQKVYYEAEGEMTAEFEGKNFIYYLVRMPEFRQEVIRVFEEKMAGREVEFVHRVERQAEIIRDDAVRDAEKWEEGDFDANVADLLEWIRTRYEYFEKVYGESDF